MKELFTLGEMYVSDFLTPNQKPRAEKIEMKVLMDDAGAVRLEKCAPLDVMYGKYFYRSGINATMKAELKDIVDSITKYIKLQDNDLWIDIASNDGTLLSYVPENLLAVGIDPADDTFKIESEKHADLIIQDFFSAEQFKKSKFGNLKAKIITSIAMFYDLERPEIFIKDIDTVLDQNGLWVLQLSYTPLMIEQCAFDNFCHEHIYYYSLFNLKTLFEANGFKIVDCQLNNVNGGSFRIYAMKESADEKYFASQTHRDVCKFRINSLLEYEKTLKLDQIKTWQNFFNKIEELKEKTISFIKEEKAKGKIIYGYGASTKGNTLLQYFDLDSSLITAIADRSPVKWGMKTVGTNIPICSEFEMRQAKPHYLLLLPWHFLDEFIEREQEFLNNGGKMIVPCPKFEIIGKNV